MPNDPAKDSANDPVNDDTAAAFKALGEKFLRPGEDVDLTNCDREPIHIPGSVQPHGVLLALQPDTLEVVQVSANSAALLGVPPAALLGRSLEAGLGGALGGAADWRAALAEPGKYARPRRLELNGQPLTLVPHRAGGLGVLEFEARPEAAAEAANDLYAGVREAALRLQAAASVAALCEIIAEEVRRLTLFDRVMVYAFDAAWNGEVVAEAKSGRSEAFLGFHFPATDIPVQARRLYTVNWIRHIADVAYAPTPLMAARAQPPLDLSHAFLRSVSPIHLEYLKNMGVGASLSISLLYQGELWGLIACHHETARHVPYETLTACEFLGQLFSMQLGARLESAEARRHLAVKTAVAATGERLTKGADVLADLEDSSAELRQVMAASGFATVLGDEVRRFGETPPPEVLLSLYGWLAEQDRPLYATDALGADYPPAEAYTAQASGLLALSVRAQERLSLLWFRPEVLQTLTWSGNPEKAVVRDGETLRPRASFAAWRQQVRGRSLPWQAFEREAALELRGVLLGALLRQLSAELDETDEAQTFAYLAAHDLKEPLRGIHNFSSFLLDDYGERLDAEGQAMLETLLTLSGRMEGLINAILHYSRVGRVDFSLREADLGRVVREACGLLAAPLRDPRVTLRVGELPTVFCDDARVMEVFLNLVGNALKYSEGDVEIEIGYLAGTPPVLYVRDTGIGVAADDQEGVFKLFKRLHGRDAYGGGSGVGLALVRRIVERHGGRIWLESTPGKGSTFSFTLAPEGGAP